MSTDVTAGAGEAYAACKMLFEDLNRLAIDFHQGVRDEGVDLPAVEQYSRSPNELTMKPNHIWVANRIAMDLNFSFAAAYVIFDGDKVGGDRAHVKIGARGRPEVWYMLGRGTRPQVDGKLYNLADAVRHCFMKQELTLYEPPLTIGSVSYYAYKDPDMNWSFVLIGFELGEIISPDDLKTRVVSPLIAAAGARSIDL